MTTVDTHAWPQTLLEDTATAPAISTGSRHALLVGALAPLAAADADRRAVEIEKHTHWVHRGPHMAGADAAARGVPDSTGDGRACDRGPAMNAQAEGPATAVSVTAVRDAVAAGAHTIPEIADVLGVPAGSVTLWSTLRLASGAGVLRRDPVGVRRQSGARVPCFTLATAVGDADRGVR
jgi:hypothetical protein